MDKTFADLTKEQFAELMATEIRAMGETGNIQYDEEEFALYVCDEESVERHRIYLGNAYNEFLSVAEEDREALLKRYTSLHRKIRATLPEIYEKALPNLLPRVQPRMFFESMRLKGAIERASDHDRADSSQFDIPYLALADHFGIGLAYDFPTHMTMINAAQLKTWGIGTARAVADATENLRKQTEEPMHNLPGQVYMSPYQDNQDASRILLTEWITKCRVKGQHLAAIPNRDTLIVTGTEDEAGIEVFLDAVETALQQPRPMSYFPLVLGHHGWSIHKLPDDHPMAQRCRFLQLRSCLEIYAEQKQMLDALHQLTDDDTFVATFTAVRNQDSGELSSYAVLSEGVKTLLPKTDRVALCRFVDEENMEALGMASWQKFMTVLGDKISKMSSYPERYLIDYFPSASEIRDLSLE